MKKAILSAAVALSLALPAQAQTSQPQKDIATVLDDLIVCTMIYSRTSQLYNAQGQPTEGNKFMSTSYAYGVVADQLALETYGEQVSQSFVDQRMGTLAASLNKSAESKKRGELDVIAEWLDYCDSMGPQVERALPSTGLQ